MVPQGSILGPFLYMFYTNECPKIVEDQVIIYLEDTSLIISEKEDCTIGENTGNPLDTLQEWFTDNNLQMNIEKTFLGMVIDERLD